MKKLILILFFFPTLSALGQNSIPIEYAYDSAGNRVMRRVIEMRIGHQEAGIVDSSRYEVLLTSTKVNVYPNPTVGVVTVESPKARYCVAKVYDSKGRLLSELPAESGVVRIDLSGCPSGYYIVDLIVDRERSSWKIIKR